MNDPFSVALAWNRALIAQAASANYFLEGLNSYNKEFMNPLITAAKIIQEREASRVFTRDPLQTCFSYYQLAAFNSQLLSRYGKGSAESCEALFKKEIDRFIDAWRGCLSGDESSGLVDYFEGQEQALRRVIREYPKAIRDIEQEYGFHFENQPESLVLETDRFELRQVAPSQQNITTDNTLKPVLIIPPFVLGANILSFLPQQQKSYAHSFANKGIPTYIRLMKDIHLTPAVQTMSLENDVEDIAHFTHHISGLHGKQVTLNGYCQGGFSSLCALLTGRLDGLVDALITCVAPMDGTKSKGLGSFLDNLPDTFNDLDYGTKQLANGNIIADGNLMGWIYKLKSIEDSGPLVAFIRDLFMLDPREGKAKEINKTVAALNYWLQNERSDLPLAVTEMSFRSYTTPVTADGTLPITLFGEKLNFKRLKEKDVAWLLCYGEADDLVEKEVALAPLDHIDVEVTPFPKGHVAIATSWSHPDSSCALDAVFGEQKHRGPVRFHLDMVSD